MRARAPGFKQTYTVGDTAAIDTPPRAARGAQKNAAVEAKAEKARRARARGVFVNIRPRRADFFNFLTP